jgi:hypothetical protein
MKGRWRDRNSSLDCSKFQSVEVQRENKPAPLQIEQANGRAPDLFTCCEAQNTLYTILPAQMPDANKLTGLQPSPATYSIYLFCHEIYMIRSAAYGQLTLETY